MKSDLYPVSNRRRLAGRLHHLGAAYDHATNVLWLRGADRRSHICIHELTHFFEHCSTPFGAFQTELHDATLALVTGFLQAHDGPVFTPVHDWARQVLRRDPRFQQLPNLTSHEELIQTFVRPWTHYVHLLQVLDGLDSPVVEQSRPTHCVDALARLESASLGTKATPLIPSVLYPSIECEGTAGRSIPIGALHVSEALAQIQEGVKHLSRPHIPPQYYILLLLWPAPIFCTRRYESSGWLTLCGWNGGEG
jgi:hypothetical protein